MSSRTEMLDLLKSRKQFFTLPQRFYSDPAFYELDLELIFNKQWIFAGTACEIASPGQYFTLTIGRTPIIVLRDRAGEIRAFFNTCRHRGFKICDAERGKSLSLACPYHQWTYDLSGKLLYAGRMHEGFDPSGIALKPIHVQTHSKAHCAKKGKQKFHCPARQSVRANSSGPRSEKTRRAK